MLSKLRFFVQNHCKPLYAILLKVNTYLRKYSSRERKKRFGNSNPEDTVYVIRIRRQTLGLMGYYMAVLGHLRISDGGGYLPVVDMMNQKNTYLSQEQVGKFNAWDYFFEPLCRVSLSQAYESKNVILSCMETPFEASPRSFYERVYKTGKLEDYFRLVKKYIRLNKKSEAIVIDLYNSLFQPIFARQKRILGVVSRSTDIIGFPGHSVQPSVEELADLVAAYMKQHNCSYVFMASDSDKAIDFFKNRFGEDKIIFNESKRYDEFARSNANVLSEMHFNRENDEYLKGMEYLSTMYLLSKCNVLFGSLVGSTIGAICMNCGAYDAIEIYDKGVY